IGDAVDEEPADPVVAVVDMDLIALAAELLGGGEAGRAGADDADRVREFARRRGRLDPALGESGLGDVFLNRADRDRVEALLDDAIALAKTVLRADAAAHFGHVVGGSGHLIGLLEAALGGQHQPVRDVVPERAMDLTIGDAALRAARRLLLGARRIELAIDLAEIMPRRRAALLRHGLARRHELQQPLRHLDTYPPPHRRPAGHVVAPESAI